MSPVDQVPVLAVRVVATPAQVPLMEVGAIDSAYRGADPVQTSSGANANDPG